MNNVKKNKDVLLELLSSEKIDEEAVQTFIEKFTPPTECASIARAEVQDVHINYGYAGEDHGEGEGYYGGGEGEFGGEGEGGYRRRRRRNRGNNSDLASD